MIVATNATIATLFFVCLLVSLSAYQVCRSDCRLSVCLRSILRSMFESPFRTVLAFWVLRKVWGKFSCSLYACLSVCCCCSLSDVLVGNECCNIMAAKGKDDNGVGANGQDMTYFRGTVCLFKFASTL